MNQLEGALNSIKTVGYQLSIWKPGQRLGPWNCVVSDPTGLSGWSKHGFAESWKNGVKLMCQRSDYSPILDHCGK
ncbi:MAG: hypothetical protein ACU841_17610, partial [Gammaproteobacteria bacterium]